MKKVQKFFFFIILFFALDLCAKKEDVQKLISIGEVNPNIKIECMYATYHNFSGQRLYPSKYYAKCYLLKEVANQLSKVQKELEKQGLGLLIFDAFRPMSVQKRMWDIMPDRRYVAPPTEGGRHTRGTTVDLTIFNLKIGEPLDMGVGFDMPIDRSHSDCDSIPEIAKQNRKLLRDIMVKHGFTPIRTEWWHFDYHDWQLHPPLDLSFQELP